MKKLLFNRYFILVACVPLFFNNARAICITTYADTTINIACGDSFNFGGVAYYLPVTQTDTFINIHSCDSVVTLHLNVTDTVYVLKGYCAGDSIWFYGRWIYSPGTNVDTLIHTPNTCDSLVILGIAIVDPLARHDTICQGDSLLFNGAYLDTAGVYYGDFNSQYGCDSLVILTLAVRPAPVVTFAWDSLGSIGGVFSGDTACLPDVYIPPFLLVGGSPPGGHYQGLGISNDSLDIQQAFLEYAHQHGNSDFGYDTITYATTLYCSQSISTILFLRLCLGVDDLSNYYLLNLYPNPAQNYLIVEYNGFTNNSQIEVVDVLGRVVKTERINSKVEKAQVDIATLSNGLYFLRIVEGGVVEQQGKFSVVR